MGSGLVGLGQDPAGLGLVGLVGLQPGLHHDSRRVPRPGGVGGDCRLFPPPPHGPLRHALWPDHPLHSVSDLRQQAHPSKVNGQLYCILRFFIFLFFIFYSVY